MTATRPEGTEQRPRPVDASSDPANYVTGIADGNLAQGVGLRDFLVGVGVVFRLDKERQQKKTAEKKRPAIRLPIRQIAMVMAPLVLAAAAYSGYQAWAGEALPTSVVGTWSTSDGRYAGRSFWLNPESVAFQNGTKGTDFSIHGIQKIKTKLSSDTLLLTIDYEADGATSTLSVAYHPSGPEIRMVNRPAIRWLRTGEAPRITR